MKKTWTVSQIIFALEYIIGAALLGYLLYWHFQVGITRFFDVDEFTHLHWAANIARGQKPYIDFFTFFTPGFYWMLAPIFWIFGKGTTLFLASRVLAFLIYVGIAAAVGYLYSVLRSKRFFLIPMILVAFLPMPFDKFMEVRPDNASVLFGLLGMIFQILATENRVVQKTPYYWFSSAVCYGISMIILVKSLPFVVVGVFAYLLDLDFFGWIRTCIRGKRLTPLAISHAQKQFLYGLGLVGGLFIVWLFSLGDISRVLYSLTSMPFEANTIGRIYIMEPHLFFFPNASFYGGWGMTSSLLLNHGIWVVGILMGVYAFLTPYIRANGDNKRAISEFLVGGVFLLTVVLYVKFFPMKHSQYLIPIAVFIAFYASDALSIFLRKISLLSPVFLIFFAIILSKQTIAVNAPKLLLSNAVQLEQTKQLRSIVKAGEQVLDLDGRFLYEQDPYDICCLPFGTFVRFLSRPPRPLREVLEEKKVPYIYQGDSGRFWELSSDMPYIESHYEKMDGWGTALWRRKDE